jgi:hypothetical protein
MLLEMNDLPKNDYDAEVDHMLVAYGYAYKVAEELVRQSEAHAESLSPTNLPATRYEKAEQISLDYFLGKPNTKAVLEEKANALVRLIMGMTDTPLFVASRLKDTNSNINLGDEEASQAQAETAALLLSLSDRSALAVLGEDDGEIFMTAAVDGVASAVQDKGIAFSPAFRDLLRKRLVEYTHLDAKGMFRAFGKTAATILNVGPDIIFDASVTNALLDSFVRWKLDDLLPCGKHLPLTRSALAST